jgi:hypothetical protein
LQLLSREDGEEIDKHHLDCGLGIFLIVEFEINPKWDLPMSEKVSYLKEWIPAKVKTVFKVLEVSDRDKA